MKTSDTIQQKLERIEGLLTAQAVRPLSVDEAAAYLGLAKSTVYKLTSSLAISHFKSAGGKKISFEKSDLDKWLLAHRVGTLEEYARERDLHNSSKT